MSKLNENIDTNTDIRGKFEVKIFKHFTLKIWNNN